MLKVRIFEQRDAAAKWLECLTNCSKLHRIHSLNLTKAKMNIQTRKPPRWPWARRWTLFGGSSRGHAVRMDRTKTVNCFS